MQHYEHDIDNSMYQTNSLVVGTDHFSDHSYCKCTKLSMYDIWQNMIFKQLLAWI